MSKSPDSPGEEPGEFGQADPKAWSRQAPAPRPCLSEVASCSTRQSGTWPPIGGKPWMAWIASFRFEARRRRCVRLKRNASRVRRSPLYVESSRPRVLHPGRRIKGRLWPPRADIPRLSKCARERQGSTYCRPRRSRPRISQVSRYAGPCPWTLFPRRGLPPRRKRRRKLRRLDTSRRSHDP